MRWPILSLVALGACSADGAQLTFSAPAGPAKAASFEIVLASPAPVPAIEGQRTSPTGTTTETVAYYLQRTVAGVVPDPSAIDRVDGFTLRIEPTTEVTDTSFIPFVLLRDADGALVAVGTFHAPGSQTPSPILVQRGEIDTYTLDLEPVVDVDGTQAVAAGQAMRVGCARSDQTTWDSGVVWRPAAGGEVRLLFPDDPASTDATARALDLDCDGHAVTPGDSAADCDDTRAAFHAGAAEACDGRDTACDGPSLLVVTCTPPPGSDVCTTNGTGLGLALCDDATGTLGTCTDDPQCACATNPTGCTRCVIAHDPVVTAGSITPCQPGIGQLATQGLCDGGRPCTVAVAAVRGGWDAAVASASNATFAREATGVGSSFLIRAQRPEGPAVTIPGAPGHHTGEVDLAIVDAAGGVHLITVDLQLSGDTQTACAATGPYSMACSP